MSADLVVQSFRRMFETVLLSSEHVQQVIAARTQRAQFAGLRIGQLAQVEFGALRVQRQDARIDSIGLGQLPDRLGKCARPARIDQHCRQPARVQRRYHKGFITTGGLDHDPCATQWRQPLDQRTNRPLIVGQRKLLAAGPQRNLQTAACPGPLPRTLPAAPSDRPPGAAPIGFCLAQCDLALCRFLRLSELSNRRWLRRGDSCFSTLCLSDDQGTLDLPRRNLSCPALFEIQGTPSKRSPLA